MTEHTEQARQFPDFLRDYGKLLSHFQSEFEPLDSKARGDFFAEFARRLVPHTEVGRRFERPIKRKATHDEGVDLECASKDGTEMLYIQAKYTIPGVDDLDTIISKFEAYDTGKGSRVQQLPLLPGEHEEVKPTSHFMIVTMQDLMSKILRKYEVSKRPSIGFYNLLKDQRRIQIVDGQLVVSLLRETYRKSHQLPSDVRLQLAAPPISFGQVFIGILPGTELKRLYEEFGEALFFENIREYLGPTSGKVQTSSGRTTVNQAIVETLETVPQEFLARNNGIVFRANLVIPADTNTLHLENASIVNGCQTTMSIVGHPSEECYVLTKIVQATDTWHIATAANFQNEIDQIKLKLARYIRPQAIRAVATGLGVQFRKPVQAESAFAVIDAIYQTEINEEEFNALFLALFSSSPRNAIANNYTEINTLVIDSLFQEGNPDREFAFETLFRLHQNTQGNAEKVEQLLHGDAQLAHLFQRFWKEDKPSYRAILAVLAACGMIRNDMYSRPGRLSYQETMEFLRQIQHIIDEKPLVFAKYYQLAFTSVALEVIRDGQEIETILRDMKSMMERVSFGHLFLKLRTLANTDSWLQVNE